MTSDSTPNTPALTLGAKPGRKDTSVAGIIRAQTNRGVDLVTILVRVAGGKYGANVTNRLKAVDMLLERGFGKVVQPHELGAGLSGDADGELVIRVQRVAARALDDDDRPAAIPALSTLVPDMPGPDGPPDDQQATIEEAQQPSTVAKVGGGDFPG